MGVKTALRSRPRATGRVERTERPSHTPGAGIISSMTRLRYLGAVGAFLALVACGDKDTGDTADHRDTGMRQTVSALTSGGATSVGTPTLAVGTSPGVGPQNFGLAGSDWIRVIEDGGSLYSQSCETGSEVDCFTAAPVEIADLPDLGVNYKVGGVYEDANGDLMLLFAVDYDGQSLAHVQVDYSGGVLTVIGEPSAIHLENAPNGFDDGFSIHYDSTGVPYVVSYGSGSTVWNLHDGTSVSLGLDTSTMDDCGVPNQLDDGSAITAIGTSCEIGIATSLEDAHDPSEVTTLTDFNSGIGANPRDPRGFGNVLTVTTDDGHYYAETGESDPGTEDPVDSDNDGVNDDEDNCPDDSNPMQDDLDGDGEGDVCDPDKDGDGVENEDDNCPEDENADQDDIDGDGVGDACDDNNDLTPQQALEQACEFAASKVTILENSCRVYEEDPFVEGGCDDGIVVLEGSCTLEVDLGRANPVIIRLDGIYGIDLEGNSGGSYSGSFEVVDNGNAFPTVIDSVVGSPVGTTYGGQEMDQKSDGSIMVHVVVPEGKVVYTHAETGEVLVTLDAGEYADINVTSGIVEATNGELPNSEPTPNNNNGGSDAPGCSQAPGAHNHGHKALMIAVLAMVGLTRKRGRKAE